MDTVSVCYIFCGNKQCLETDECVVKEKYYTAFKLVPSEKATRFYLNFSKNFSDLFEYLEKNKSALDFSIFAMKVTLNLSEHYNYSVWWGGKGLKVSLDFSFSDCVNSSFRMDIKLNLPLYLQYNDLFILTNRNSNISLTEYCPAVRGVPIRDVIEAAGSIQSATSPILNVVIVFSSTINVQGVSASILLSISKFIKFRAPESIQTAFDTEKGSWLREQLQTAITFPQTTLSKKKIANLRK